MILRSENGPGGEAAERRTRQAVRMATCLVCLPLLIVCLLGNSLGAEERPQSPAAGDARHDIGKNASGEDLVVARVNGVSITEDSLVRMMAHTGPQKGRDMLSPEEQEKIRQRALDRLVLQELAYEQAKKEGMLPGEKEVESALADMKKKAGGEEGFHSYLAKEGLTESDMRSAVARNLALQRILSKEVLSITSVPEEDMRREYEEEKAAFFLPEKISIIDIVFFLDVNSPDSLQKVKDVRARLAAAPDHDPWKLSPDGTFVVRDLELTSQSDKALVEEARKLEEGQISDIVTTADSLHIFKLKEYKKEKQLKYDDVKGFIERKLLRQAQQKRMNEWEAELKKGAKIEILDAHHDEAR